MESTTIRIKVPQDFFSMSPNDCTKTVINAAEEAKKQTKHTIIAVKLDNETNEFVFYTIGPQLFCTRNKEFGKIEPVKNTKFIKPVGGLWTSTYTPEEEYQSAWIEWCIREEPEWIKDVNFFLLVPKEDAQIYVIDCYEDLEQLYSKFGISSEVGLTVMDWEEIAKHYDGVMLTEAGQVHTRFSHPLSLYGWDCESTVWFRDVFEGVKKIEINI